MSDYTYAAEQIKEGIINQYLKEHPGVHRSEIIAKTINGKILVGTIQETFKTMEGRNKLPDAKQIRDQKILDQLARGGDERYAESLQSISNSNQYIEWLSVSKNTGFSPQDKNDQEEYLNRQASICSARALDLHEAKRKFVQTLKGEMKPSRSAVNTILMEYLQAVFGQLKSQKAIFTREVELGDRFSHAVMQFFNTQFSSVHARPNPAAMRAIARSIAILRDNQIQVPDIKNPNDMKMFNGALCQLQEKLQKRREQFASLQQLIEFLEKAIEGLKASMEAEGEEKSPNGDYRRMAFSTRKDRSR